MRAKAMLTGMVAAALLATPAQAQQADPRGAWMTASGNVAVEIAPCAQALCGTVVRVFANRSMAEAGKAAMGRPATTGMRILTDLTPSGAGWRGKIYNRENGRTYDCIVQPAGADRLDVRAYVVLPLFGQTQLWRRATPAELAG